jgi:hypothetical protein
MEVKAFCEACVRCRFDFVVRRLRIAWVKVWLIKLWEWVLVAEDKGVWLMADRHELAWCGIGFGWWN